MGLHLTDGNILEEFGEAPSTPRSCIMLTPALVVHCDDEEAGSALARDVGAQQLSRDEASIPLHAWVCDCAAHEIVNGDEIEITFSDSGRPGIGFRVNDRLIHFLRLTHCLGFAIVTPKKLYIATIGDGTHSSMALVAIHSGSTGSSQLNKMLALSDRWRAVLPFNARLLAGDSPLNEVEYVYFAFESREFLPKPFQRDCLMCGREDDLTAEHCVPKWLVDRIGVSPVVATILCQKCNNQLGTTVEPQISTIFANREMSDASHHGEVSYWILKTAIMLAAAANASLPREVVDAMRSKRVDDSFTLYWDHFDDDGTAERFYRFSIAHLRKDLVAQGNFVLTFETNDFAFCVARLIGVDASPVPVLPMRHPQYEAPIELARTLPVQHYLLRQIGVDFTSHTTAVGRTPSPRTKRGKRNEL